MSRGLDYNINCLISNDERAYLQYFLKTNHVSISIEDFDDITSTIRLTIANSIKYMINIPTIQDDGDEYPKITVVSELEYSNRCKWRCLGEGKIKKMTVIRDEVTWERIPSSKKDLEDYWVFKADALITAHRKEIEI